jgi:hypothetical protein
VLWSVVVAFLKCAERAFPSWPLRPVINMFIWLLYYMRGSKYSR